VARPDAPVTFTIAYSNSGADAASNFYINDVVPFNSYISETAAQGSATSLEYYVAGGWTSTYNAAATRVRWKFNNLGPGASGNVSYKVKIK
jgi:uncharacterized repeat protein (TIGR01451 family)